MGRVLIIGFMLLLQLSCRNKEPDQVRGNLVQVQTFGDGYSNVEGYITRAIYMATDHSNNLYIADQGKAGILKYKFDGEFVQLIGSAGRGPEEFGSSLKVDVAENLIGIIDYDNFRISLLNPQGKMMNMFDISHLYFGEFALSKERILLGARASRFQTTNLENEDRFYLYDLQGNKIRSFGKFLVPENSSNEIPAEMSRALVKTYNGFLHVAYVYFPIYQIYDLNRGVLLAEHDLKELTSVESAEQNKEVSSPEDLFSSQTNTNVSVVISGLEVVNDRVFIRRYKEDLFFVDEFQLRGTELDHTKSHILTKESVGTKYLANFVFVPSRQSFFSLEVSAAEGFRISEYKITKPREMGNPPATGRLQ